MGMAVPEPVTLPANDKGIRTHTAFDLERTLVGFLTNLFSTIRLDNPTLSVSQATSAQPDTMLDPDQPPVPYDPKLRQETLALKVAPRVFRGRVPRTVTGEIDVNQLANVPNIIVQAMKAKIDIEQTTATVKICFTTYDENPDSQGYQDCLNMMEAAGIALMQFGQAGLDKAFPLVPPIDWEFIESPTADYYPHFIGEMTTQWQLLSAHPWVFPDTFGIVPAESLETRQENLVP